MSVSGIRRVGRGALWRTMLLSGAFWLVPSAICGAEEPSGRPISLGVNGGLRVFNSQVGLNEDASMGARVGLGVGSRVRIMLDYVVVGANREEGDGTATAHSLRTLARFDFLQGGTRPYMLTGLGGLLFDFNDAQDYATGTLTVGYGLDHRLGTHAHVTLEGTLDLYRNRTVVYSSTGEELSRTPRNTQGLGNVALGLELEF